MTLNYYKYCSLVLVSLSITINTSISVDAKDISEVLPPVNRWENKTLPPNTSNQNQSNSREYTFKAPNNKTLTHTGQFTAQDYLVEVYGSAAELLLQVREVEPTAFIKGDIIQVGIFSQQNNAENMARKLAAKGLWARIVTN
jgi:cell division protein FtsN